MDDLSVQLALDFGRYGNSVQYCREGWCDPEPTQTWTSGLASGIEAPRPDLPGTYVLQFDVAPLVDNGSAAPQRLTVSVNETPVGTFEICERVSLECPVDWQVIARSPALQIKFEHPDAAPRPDQSGHADEPLVALAFATLVLFRVGESAAEPGHGASPARLLQIEPASRDEPPPHHPPRAAHRANQLRAFDVKNLGDLVYEQINAGNADVSVIIPLYDYQTYIAECLDSVINQDIARLSIVVIDDRSNDAGGDLAVKILESNKERFVAARVIRHRRNQGLAMSRNSGIAWSTEPFLFMLDADNRIRPPALSRLLEAILTSGREFAYSQLWMFGNMSGVGVADTWDPERFHYCNYIDGMALIKRSALLATRGYRVSAVQDGWEDFDVWCQFAELGYQGIYLPELLCEYRVHPASMVHTRTNYQRRALSLEMVLRHPALFGEGIIPPFVDSFAPDTR